MEPVSLDSPDTSPAGLVGSPGAGKGLKPLVRDTEKKSVTTMNVDLSKARKAMHRDGEGIKEEEGEEGEDSSDSDSDDYGEITTVTDELDDVLMQLEEAEEVDQNLEPMSDVVSTFR